MALTQLDANEAEEREALECERAAIRTAIGVAIIAALNLLFLAVIFHLLVGVWIQ